MRANCPPPIIPIISPDCIIIFLISSVNTPLFSQHITINQPLNLNVVLEYITLLNPELLRFLVPKIQLHQYALAQNHLKQAYLPPLKLTILPGLIFAPFRSFCFNFDGTCHTNHKKALQNLINNFKTKWDDNLGPGVADFYVKLLNKKYKNGI